jgi:formiminotetrahydrofolate cyclodeaminase
MFKYANKSATSDFGVGVMMINAGLIGAILNVRTNMVGFSDHEVSERFLKAVDEIEMKAKEIIHKAITDVYTILK